MDKRSFINSHTALKYFCALLISLCVAFCIYTYVLLVERGFLAFEDVLQVRFKIVLLFVLTLFFMMLFFLFRQEKNRTIIFRYRWLLACILFAICIAFELSGSSIGILIDMLGGDGSALIGSSRGIRSDEWMVYTPMSISQCTTDGGVFSYFQDAMRSVETDMFCVYGQPVWDIAEVFRPFHWGYLVLGASKGLSFFWCGRLIFLFMVSFEFAYRILIKKSKALSFGYASLVALSSVVQWWFAVNSLVEILLFGQLALIWASLYMKSDSYKARFGYALGIAWCLGIYILAFYPAWQISFAYVFLALLIALMVTELPQMKKSYKDMFLILLIIAIVIGVITYVFLFKSWETVQIELNTAYPGKRDSSGGGAASALFAYPFTAIFPVSQSGIYPNVCEASSFFTFFPLSLFMPFLIMIKKRRSIIVLSCLLIVFFFLAIYSVFGVPDFVANLTLLSKTTPQRCIVAAQYALILLLFASLEYVKEVGFKLLLGLCFGSFVLLFLGFTFLPHEISLIKYIIISTFALFMLLTVLFVAMHKNALFCIACICTALLCGALVNPVRGGLEGYFSNELADTLQEWTSEENIVAVTDAPLLINNVPASFGCRTLNSTNVYPQLDTWSKLDPDGQYMDIYNRYAHILIDLKDSGDPTFVLNSPDSFVLSVTPSDLKKVGVNRLLSCDGEYKFDNVILEKQVGSFFLYELN